jgi:hypothetical protein
MTNREVKMAYSVTIEGLTSCVSLCLVQEIKARKLSELTEAGVPEKYRAELEKYKVGYHQA